MFNNFTWNRPQMVIQLSKELSILLIGWLISWLIVAALVLKYSNKQINRPEVESKHVQTEVAFQKISSLFLFKAS